MKRALVAHKVFKNCDACGSHELVVIGAEVFCGDCDWNSIEWSIKSGCMDNLKQAFKDHFGDQKKEITLQTNPGFLPELSFKKIDEIA